MGKKRGRERVVSCEICGLRFPRIKARIRYRFGRKVYICLKCAKKQGLIGRFPREGEAE